MIVDFHLTDRECDILDQGGFLKIRLPDDLVIVFSKEEDTSLLREEGEEE